MLGKFDMVRLLLLIILATGILGSDAGAAQNLALKANEWRVLPSKDRLASVEEFMSKIGANVSAQSRADVLRCTEQKARTIPDYLPAIMVIGQCLVDLGIAKSK